MDCRRTTISSAGSWSAVALLVALAACTSEKNPCETAKCDPGLVCVEQGDSHACVPPGDPCGAGNPCKADQRCVVTIKGTASCLSPDRCAGVSCETGKRCSPDTGQCVAVPVPCAGVTCNEGETCNPSTGRCEDANSKCLALCCNFNEVCDPVQGACVPDLCYGELACRCGPSTTCNSVTGNCDPVVGACGNCTASQYCDASIGACVDIAAGTPNAGEIGSGCASTADCTRSGSDAFCIVDGGLFGEMPRGSCSANCDVSGCPSGSGCVDVGLQLCLDICLTNADCREGYSCVRLSNEDSRSYCFPSNKSGSACTGPDCSPAGGSCNEDTDCASGLQCARNLPGGYCQSSSCGQGNTFNNSLKAWCLVTDPCAGSTIALAGCDISLQNCRSGYACLTADPNRTDGNSGFCYLRNCEEDTDCNVAGTSCTNVCDTARGICDARCTSDLDCDGGRACDTTTGRCFQPCRYADANCGPDAFCDTALRRCVRNCRSDASCPQGTFCDRAGGQCKPLCTADTDCTGISQFCDSLGRCRARCADDSACGSNEYCESGRCLPRCAGSANCSFGSFCEPSTGRCQADLKTVLVGNTCNRDGDCGPYNGKCLLSFPSGYCVAPGCSAETPCGAGATCLELGAEGSVCARGCETDSDCRGGYRCAEQAGTKACLPR